MVVWWCGGVVGANGSDGCDGIDGSVAVGELWVVAVRRLP